MKGKLWKDEKTGNYRFIVEISPREVEEALDKMDIITKFMWKETVSHKGKLALGDTLCALWFMAEALLKQKKEKKRKGEPEVESELLSAGRLITPFPEEETGEENDSKINKTD